MKKRKPLNSEEGTLELRTTILESYRVIEEENRLKKENAGYMVQYMPCGHAREIRWNEFELVARAKANTRLDAITDHSSNCPICKAFATRRARY